MSPECVRDYLQVRGAANQQLTHFRILLLTQLKTVLFQVYRYKVGLCAGLSERTDKPPCTRGARNLTGLWAAAQLLPVTPFVRSFEMGWTRWDASFDPRLRQIVHRLEGVDADQLSRQLAAANINTLAAASELRTDSSCLESLTAQARDSLLLAL